MKNILIFCTRSLCYFSGEFFARELAEIFENKGDKVETIILPDEPGSTALNRDLSKFSILEKYIGKSFDAVIDFNSFLPYLSDDDGTSILDEINSPFYNYLLDHPLYHHPGLSFHLRNYNVICIDKRHAEYVRKYYPHIKNILYKPLPGAVAPVVQKKGADYREPGSLLKSEISNNLFFSGTFMSENELYKELSRRPEEIRNAVLEILGIWDPENLPIEDAVKEYLDSLNQEKKNNIYASVFTEEKQNKHMDFNTDNSFSEEMDEAEKFPVLMNHMYSLDRIMRYRMREKVITEIAKAGIELDIQGEGWENLKFPNVHLIEPSPMEESIFEIARHKYILDINPLFFEGLHDRVSTAFVNGATVFSNMNPSMVPKVYEKMFYHYSYKKTDELINLLKEICV